jgi:hypothetical protein
MNPENSRDSDGTDWQGPRIRELELRRMEMEFSERRWQPWASSLGPSVAAVVAIVAVSWMSTNLISSARDTTSFSMNRLNDEVRALRHNEFLDDRIRTLEKQVEELRSQIRELQAQQKMPEKEKTPP